MGEKDYDVCNSKQNGFRKALKGAAKHPTAIDDAALAGTQWEHIMPANTKLYDLLSAVCESDALLKIETTPGDDQGFEAWRRIARQFDPISKLTKIERLNQILNTETCKTIKELMGKIEVWEQAWTKYELDQSESPSMDIKPGALMKMLPDRERETFKLKYVENESDMTYPVLRRQVEYWIDSLTSGPAPMDLSIVTEETLASLPTEQLEELLALRKGGGKKGGGRAPKAEERKAGKERRFWRPTVPCEGGWLWEPTGLKPGNDPASTFMFELALLSPAVSAERRPRRRVPTESDPAPRCD